MERVEQYRQAIRQLLTNKAALEQGSSYGEIECQLVFDTEHDHYQMLDLGWEDFKRIYHCFIHIDIKDGKIWIQRNMTEADLAQELVEMRCCQRRYCAWVTSTLQTPLYWLWRCLGFPAFKCKYWGEGLKIRSFYTPGFPAFAHF